LEPLSSGEGDLLAHRSIFRLVLPTARVADWPTQLVRAQMPKE
jgi:hypothetical protein